MEDERVPRTDGLEVDVLVQNAPAAEAARGSSQPPVVGERQQDVRRPRKGFRSAVRGDPWSAADM